jgi:SAM-dependent methyltransferase
MVRKPSLDTAYSLKSAADNLALYADWATTYDDNFALEMDFLMPSQVAEAFREKGGSGPVLDAGAGTGLVADQLLKLGKLEIDAFDLSPDMLRVAGAKGLYRQTFVGDLTKPLPFEDGAYNTVVSAGTFTHGHVGPEAVDELIRVAARGALFVVTIKADVFEPLGFARKFETIAACILDFDTTRKPIYGPGATGEHRDDMGLLVTFRKA